MSEVILRQWRREDAEPLAAIANNPKIWLNLRDRFPHPYTKENAHEWIDIQVSQTPPSHNFCIEYKEQVAGSIALMPLDDIYRLNMEIGYFIGEPFWGKGIATKAINAMLTYAEKQTDAVRIFAGVFAHNKASMNALRRNGFYLESIRRKAVIKDSRTLDDYVWVKLIDREYES